MDESVSDLYIRLGLDIADLNSGFVDAEKTLSQNIQTLNQQNNLIQLKAQVELSGLDETADSTEALRIQQEALNQMLAVQEDRIQLTAAAYQEMVQAQGENSQAAYNLAISLEQERLAMNRLQSQSQALAQQEEIALGINLEMLGLIEPTMKLTELAAGGASSLSILGHAIPVPQVKIATAALVGLSAVVAGTIDATDELAENHSVQTFAENTQTASAGIGNSFSDMQSFALSTADIIDKSFESVNNATFEHLQQMQEEGTTFVDWARDFFRVAFLLAEESDNFSDAISKVNAQSQFMRTELGEYAVVAAGIIHTLDAISKMAISFVEPSVKGFRELRDSANELNISLGKTQEFQTLLDLSGADYNDVRDYVRGVQDAVIKGDSEDPEVIALTKYGVAIQDAHGKLLPFNETLENLYQGYLKAREAGEAEAYVIMTNGQAVQDVLPFFERLAKAHEDYAKIKWSTSDFDALQKTSDSLKLLEIQSNEFNNSLQTLGLPLGDYFAQNKFKFYKTLTELVEENREEVLYWEFVVIEALKRVDAVVDDVLNSITGKSEEPQSIFGKLIDSFRATSIINPFDSALTNLQQSVIKSLDILPEQYGNHIKGFLDFYDKSLDSINQKLDVAKNAVGKLIDSFGSTSFTNPLEASLSVLEKSLNQTVDLLPEQYRSQIKSFLDFFSEEEAPSIFDEAKKDVEEYIDANEKARAETQKTAEEITAGLSSSHNRIAKYKEELAGIKLNLEFGDNSYQKSLSQLDIWYEKAMRDARYYAEEKSAIDELYNAKADQIKRNRLEKISEIRESVAREGRSELENRLTDIETEKQAWINAGMEIAEAEQLARQKISAVISGEVQKIKDNIQSLTSETSDIEFEITHDAFEKQMRDIELWKDAQLEKADTAEEVAATIENAAMKEAEAFEREMDRIKGKIESGQDRLARLTMSQRDYDVYKVNKQYQEDRQELPEGLANALYQAEMNKINQRARQDSGGNYTKNPNGGTNLNNDYLIEFGKQVEDTTKNWIEMDASQLAYKKTLEKSIDNISEFDRGFQQSSDDVNKWNNNIESAVQNAANKFDEFNPDTAVDNLNNTLNSISDHAGNLNGAIDKNINALNKATSATATFNRAMKIVQNIETNKPQDFPLPQNDSTPKGNYELIYGANIAQLRNEKNYNPQGQIEMFEGADLKSGADNFPQADIDNATNEVVNSLNQIPPPVTEVANSFSQLPPSVNDAVKSIMDQTTAAQENITANDTANKALNDALSNLATHSENVATALQSTADIILEVNDKLADFNVNTASQQDSSGGMSNMDVAKLSADIVSNIGEGVALAGAATGNPLVALGGGVVSFMGNVGSNIFDNLGGDSPFNNAGGTGNTDNYPNITEAIQSFQTEMSSLLGELSQTTSNISANVEQFTQKDTTPPNITVSPNINIDLGGAYVFDNAMKKQLADDITTEVANAIKNAVQSAVNSNDYGYGT